MTAASPVDLSRFLAAHYDTVKTLHPGEGRRKWRLRVAQQFWALSPADKQAYLQTPPIPEGEAAAAPYTTDDDPLDEHSTHAPGLGVLIRTDFSDEPAWQAFLLRLKDAESEFASASTEDDAEAMEEDPPAPSSSSSSSEEEDEADPSAPIIHILTHPPPSLTNLTNLAALRLLTDVSIRPAPPPPRGTLRHRPRSRLVDHGGWQEVYVGKTVWVYDARSNVDQCVRLVSGRSADGVYGTATADSWRARVSHVCELQVNVASGAMAIDFGGLDRWEYRERLRNMAEAEAGSGG